MLSHTAAAGLSGLSAAQSALASSTHNIANVGTPGFRRQEVQQLALPSGGVSVTSVRSAATGDALETDVIGLLQAKHAFLANLAVFRAGDRMTGSLLDTLG